MTTATLGARSRLKVLAKKAAKEVFLTPKEERAATITGFKLDFDQEIEDRELRFQIQTMIDEGCPNLRDDD